MGLAYSSSSCCVASEPTEPIAARDRRLGWDVCDFPQSASRRTTGWRPHRLRGLAALSQEHLASHGGGVTTDGNVSVDWMARLGRAVAAHLDASSARA